MNNVLLGKTIKAMYKLSGKTLPQLSDEIGLTIDTINNLFYARVQKPGLAGVQALVKAMGFSLQQLIDFMDANPELPEDSDVTGLFTAFISAAEDTGTPVPAAKTTVPAAKGSSLPAEIELLNAEHERQLDRFRATHQRYVEQLKEQHSLQIEQMQAHSRQMEQHYDHSVAELKDLHARETGRLERDNTRLRRSLKALVIAVIIENGLFLLLLILDMINRGVGWMR